MWQGSCDSDSCDSCDKINNRKYEYWNRGVKNNTINCKSRNKEASVVYLLYCSYTLNCKVTEFNSHCLQYFFLNKSTWPSKIPCGFLAPSLGWAWTRTGNLAGNSAKEILRGVCTESMRNRWGSVNCLQTQQSWLLCDIQQRDVHHKEP